MNRVAPRPDIESYRRSRASSDGNCALKIANAPFRARPMVRASAGDRIGITWDRFSSSLRISAMARRKASPFFRELVSKYADIATRIRTASAEIGGRSPSVFWRVLSNVSRIAIPPGFYPKPAGHHVAVDGYKDSGTFRANSGNAGHVLRQTAKAP